jgi:hypothetical protein
VIWQIVNGEWSMVHSAVASKNGAAPGLALGAVFLLFPILGWWEVAIGVALLVRPLVRALSALCADGGGHVPATAGAAGRVVSNPVSPRTDDRGEYLIKNLA